MNSKQAVQLDAIDWRIVEALQADGRASLSSLGKKVGLSQPAVSERVKRLEVRGVIEGYSARINFRAESDTVVHVIAAAKHARADEIPER